MQFLCKLDPFQSNRPYIKEKYYEYILNHRFKGSCDSAYYTYM